MLSSRLYALDAPAAAPEQSPARPACLVAGALAHLATHLGSGCPRAAYLATLLLDKLANDPEVDAHLRRHARELVDILDAAPRTPAPRAIAALPAYAS
jgi:hypothetical protein